MFPSTTVQVCSGTTGHTEAMQLIFDPTVCSYEQLCKTLFQTISPDATKLNQKGNDRGTQVLPRCHRVTLQLCPTVTAATRHSWCPRA